MIPRALLACAIGLTISSATLAKDITIPVPTDSKARYTVLEIRKAEGGLVEIRTRRDGPSGSSTATRRVDCSGKQFAYTEDDGSPVTEPLTPLVTGSISYYVSEYACSKR